MKTLILKKMMPVAVFVLAISGAFLTTSMQSDAIIDDEIDGYATPIGGTPCSVPVECSDEFDEVCRLVEDDDESPQAFGLDGTTCPIILYRP
ncbi:DUF6520 family protein [Flavobacterium sp. EDS]|uniref:DUF6520 family protein n=1 Tax=Flavobacterium sp. EDS TaxID=2897328 RepID=UPI001E552F47|nr:DUF6520 family protein [Flavobacterium sp. EDS]MCD0474049.1 DUF6520 family protein [Flavobacterium sp. EDS]